MLEWTHVRENAPTGVTHGARATPSAEGIPVFVERREGCQEGRGPHGVKG